MEDIGIKVWIYRGEVFNDIKKQSNNFYVATKESKI